MDFLKYRSIDLFRYTFPGLFLIIDFELFRSSNFSVIDTVVTLVSKLDIKQGIVLTLFAYFIGFCIDPIGRQFRYKIAQKIWKTPKRKDDGLEINDNDKYVLTKHFTERNFTLIETWDMLKGMAANLSIGTSLCFILSIYKIFSISFTHNNEWIWLAVFSISGSFCLWYQTHNFEKFSVEDMNAAIKSLNLIEKGKSLKD